MQKYFRGKLRDRILERDNYLCVNCGSDDNLEIDHIINSSCGGETSYENGQVLCAECNQEKENYRNLQARWMNSDKTKNEFFKYNSIGKILSEKILKQIESMNEEINE